MISKKIINIRYRTLKKKYKKTKKKIKKYILNNSVMFTRSNIFNL